MSRQNRDSQSAGVDSSDSLVAKWWDAHKESMMWSGAWVDTPWEHLADNARGEVAKLFFSSTNVDRSDPANQKQS